MSSASPTKQQRRSRQNIADLREAIYAIASDESVPAVSVRQVFYRLVVAGLIAKTEAEYNQTVVRLIKEMRLAGDLPWEWIADNSRWMRKPTTYGSVDSFLDTAASAYRVNSVCPGSIQTRRTVYNVLPDRIRHLPRGRLLLEVWLEKEALAGVLYPLTAEWDVPLMVTRGYPSLTFLYEAAQVMRRRDGQFKTIYYLGDRDPSGLDIARNVEERLEEFGAGVDAFERLAVTESQVDLWNLPTRPTKQTDSRAANFAGESVEVDAIEPALLVNLVRNAILEHVDEDAYAKLRQVEAEEREGLRKLTGR